MSLHNGTAAETERKKMLEAEGHIVINLGQNQYGDLEDVCHNVIIEVKTSKNARRDLSRREKEQMRNLMALSPWRRIRYDIRFHGNHDHGAIWQSEFPDRIVSSFKLGATMNPPENGRAKTNSKRMQNKLQKVKP